MLQHAQHAGMGSTSLQALPHALHQLPRALLLLCRQRLSLVCLLLLHQGAQLLPLAVRSW